MVGTVCPRGTTGAKMLPSMATPRERGTTSRSKRSAVSAEVAFPDKIPAWTAAPYATASSGLMLFSSFFPSKKSLKSFWIFGIRVDPPTRTISSTLLLSMLASLRTWATGSKVPLKALELRSSKRARVIWALKSSPSKRESISTVVWAPLERVLLARSQAVRRRLRARGSPDKSFLVFLWNSFLK